jgi:hypothetical protein
MNKLAASISCLLPKSNDIVFVIVVKGQILVDLQVNGCISNSKEIKKKPIMVYM